MFFELVSFLAVCLVGLVLLLTVVVPLLRGITSGRRVP